jgi:hypothetical protein
MYKLGASVSVGYLIALIFFRRLSILLWRRYASKKLAQLVQLRWKIDSGQICL